MKRYSYVTAIFSQSAVIENDQDTSHVVAISIKEALRKLKPMLEAIRVRLPLSNPTDTSATNPPSAGPDFGFSGLDDFGSNCGMSGISLFPGMGLDAMLRWVV